MAVFMFSLAIALFVFHFESARALVETKDCDQILQLSIASDPLKEALAANCRGDRQGVVGNKLRWYIQGGPGTAENEAPVPRGVSRLLARINSGGLVHPYQHLGEIVRSAQEDEIAAVKGLRNDFGLSEPEAREVVRLLKPNSKAVERVRTAAKKQNSVS